uniref:Ig-like domain-containing protein n=1 Tax=Rubrolithibacter danxiaensis TaxID=3390805 RepID=UPI003BF80342
MKTVYKFNLLKFLVITLLLSGINTYVNGQTIITPFKIRYQVEQRGGIVYVSNNILTAKDYNNSSKNAYNAVRENPPGGNDNNNSYNGKYIDIDTDNATFSSSSADLALPNCSEISFAGLYWGGAVSSGNPRYNDRNKVQIKLPSQTSYTSLSADVDFLMLPNGSVNFHYQYFKDITSIVNANGIQNGTYTLANVVADEEVPDVEAGWTIVIVYKQELENFRNLTVFDGFAGIPSNSPDLTIPISGFLTPPTGTVSFELGYIAYEGDRGVQGDVMLFNGKTISDNAHDNDNTFNSSITNNGTVVTTRNPAHANTLGYDASIIFPKNYKNGNAVYLNNSATSADIKLRTASDKYTIGEVSTAIDVYNPYFTFTHTYTNVSPGGLPAVKPGETIQLLYQFKNIGNDISTKSSLYNDLPSLLSNIKNLQVSYDNGSTWKSYTNASDNDQAEYIAATNRVNFRLGAGANATTGGAIAAGSTVLVRFEATLTTDCDLLRCTSGTFGNFGMLDFYGNVNASNHYTLKSAPVPAAGQCAISGPLQISADIPSVCLSPYPDRSYTIACSIDVSEFSLPANYTLYNPADLTTPLTTVSSAGTYTARRVTANGCTYTFNVNVVVIPVTVTLTNTKNVTCTGGTDGKASLSTSGGTGTYTYSWKKNTVALGTPPDLNNLTAGTYEVTATDGNGCTGTAIVTITEPDVLQVVFDKIKDADCNGSTGKIDFSYNYPPGDVIVTWYDGSNTPISAPDPNALPAGSYKVKVKDKNCGTEVSSSVVIIEPSALEVTFEKVKDADCTGAPNGKINFSYENEVGTIHVKWLDENGAEILPAPDPNALAPGSYQVEVWDDCNDHNLSEIIIVSAVALRPQLTKVQDAICPGSISGKLNLNILYANGSVQQQWYKDGGPIPTPTLNASNEAIVDAGVYKVDVKDDCNIWVSSDAVEIKDPAPILITLIKDNDVSCNGGNDGKATLTIQNGQTPFISVWKKDNVVLSTPPDLTNLTAGTYTLTLTDNNGCTESLSSPLVISQPNPISIVFTKTKDVSCFGGNDGEAILSVTGGTATYTKFWKKDGVALDYEPVLNQLVKGTYEVSVTDNNGCNSSSSSIIISEPAQLTVSLVKTKDVTCEGGNDGKATLNIQGGIPNYTEVWKKDDITLASAPDLNNLTIGKYEVIVSDQNNCTASSATIYINKLVSMSAELIKAADATCPGGDDGIIRLIISDDRGPITKEWFRNGISIPEPADLDKITAGKYYVKVNDGCSAEVITEEIEVLEPANITPVADNDNYSGFEDNTVAGNISGKVSDDNTTCEVLTLSKVSDPLPAEGTVSFDPFDGSFTFTPQLNWNGTTSFTYRVTDRLGLFSDATVTITIAPVNDIPVVAPVSKTADEDHTVAFSAADFSSKFT